MAIDSRIYLITFKETDRDSIYYGRILVSHGVGDVTLQSYCLPCDPIERFNDRKFDLCANEWYLETN